MEVEQAYCCHIDHTLSRVKRFLETWFEMLESIINSESTAGRKMKTERRSKCFNRKFSHPISPDLTTLSSVLQQLLLWSVVPSLPCCSLEIVKPPFGQQKTVKAYVVTMQLGGTNYEMIWFARYSTMFPAMTCSIWPIWQPRRLIVLSKTLAKRKVQSSNFVVLSVLMAWMVKAFDQAQLIPQLFATLLGKWDQLDFLG